jgi:hypothetical protein
LEAKKAEGSKLKAKRWKLRRSEDGRLLSNQRKTNTAKPGGKSAESGSKISHPG